MASFVQHRFGSTWCSHIISALPEIGPGETDKPSDTRDGVLSTVRRKMIRTICIKKTMKAGSAIGKTRQTRTRDLTWRAISVSLSICQLGCFKLEEAISGKGRLYAFLGLRHSPGLSVSGALSDTSTNTNIPYCTTINLMWKLCLLNNYMVPLGLSQIIYLSRDLVSYVEVVMKPVNSATSKNIVRRKYRYLKGWRR